MLGLTIVELFCVLRIPAQPESAVRGTALQLTVDIDLMNKLPCVAQDRAGLHSRHMLCLQWRGELSSHQKSSHRDHVLVTGCTDKHIANLSHALSPVAHGNHECTLAASAIGITAKPS